MRGIARQVNVVSHHEVVTIGASESENGAPRAVCFPEIMKAVEFCAGAASNVLGDVCPVAERTAHQRFHISTGVCRCHTITYAYRKKCFFDVIQGFGFDTSLAEAGGVATAHCLNHRYSEVCDLTLGAQYDGRPYAGESTILESDGPATCPTVVSSRPMHFIEAIC